MPNLHETCTGFEPCMDIQVMTIGGSLLHPPESPWLDTAFFKSLKVYLKEQLAEKRSVIGIIGGGEVARRRQAAAKEVGITDKNKLDWFGIFVTKQNALFLKDLMQGVGIRTREYVNQKKLRPGVLYVGGGTAPGHTTDYVAVQAAVNAGVNYVIKMSNTPGLHPFFENGKHDDTRIISYTTYDDVLPFVSGHNPGAHGPDKAALELAKAHNITFIALGPDFENLGKCLCGEDFIGSVITPSAQDSVLKQESPGISPDLPTDQLLFP